MDYDAVRKYILDTSGVTVAEVIGILEHKGVDVLGEYVFYWPYEPVVIWAGTSAEAADVLRRLVADADIEVHPTPMMTYAMDGLVLDLPLATPASLRKHYPYKTERWFPVVFNRRATPRD